MSILRRLTAAPVLAAAAGAAALTTAMAAAPASQAGLRPSFIGGLHKITTVASTVPRNGDVNPYGVAVIRQSTGSLHAGSVLVSNFNNAKNLQGTGTTIVQVSPGGHRTTFARLSPGTLPGSCPGGAGLTTALAVLPGGWVVVGSLPTTDGSAATAKAGCLIVLDSHGKARETFSGRGINGPWDMAAVSRGHAAALFVTNVLNGTVAGRGNTVHMAPSSG